MEIELPFVRQLEQRLHEPKPLIQVVLGPRQVGKTTGVQQLLKRLKLKSLYSSADSSIATPAAWIEEQWQLAEQNSPESVLVIDEIQKIENWSETVKKLWDKQPRTKRLKLVLLGSSSLKLQRGLTESLTGRFELIRVHHWNFQETRQAFGCDLETYLTFGGYPGAYEFIGDAERWYAYIKNSIIETVIGKDILSLQSVLKPALFRQVFELLCAYPAQEISYTKLLGQLQDKGNTDLVKRYIQMYEGAFLFRALECFSSKSIKTKSSSPKILPLCPALATMSTGTPIDAARRGHVFELCVGADLNRLPGDLFYWRERDFEVDYVYKEGRKVFAVEVKSSRKRKFGGLAKFISKFPGTKPVIIAAENYEQFSEDPKVFLERIEGQ